MAAPYDDRTKAAALAQLATGASVSATAKALGISRRTLTAWRDAAHLPDPAPVAHQKRADLGEHLYGYLEDSIGALRSQLAVFADPAWLGRQPAGELAILHGVVADKTARLLAAVRAPEPEPGDAIEGALAEGGGDRGGL